ncbi:MAG: HD domain-containing protein [Planctomycetaceae bacterium]|jgi:3'-5' exoribonuclease|nr:HD domain-containing protein [Planctomycetaceae bacterium]
MSRQYINQFRDNEKVEEIYLISDKQLKSNKNGNFYLQFNLSDKTGVISARLWNIADEVFYQFDNGDYVLVEGIAQRFQGTLQFIAKKLTRIDTKKNPIDETEFLRFNYVDVTKKRARLLELLHSIKDPDLRNLTDCILLDEELMERFCRAPAGIKLHHAYPGGLLEHSVQMMEVVECITNLYTWINRDLLLVGAFLHDIGKTVELSFSGETFYSDQGQMLGHSFLGIEILSEKIKETEKNCGEPFNTETMMILKHLLLSHHGAYENQSAKLPMTLEAVALYLIDSFDSKLAEFRKYIIEDPNLGGDWTNYIPGIERKLYKGKTETN